MSDVKAYDVVVNGVETRLKLDEAAARRYGVFKEPAKPKAPAKPKSPAKAAAPKSG